VNQTTPAYEPLIEKFVAWAQTRLDIRAVIVLGSRARDDRPADEWSDLDIVILVTDPKPYLTRTDWLKSIGNFWITFVEPTATGGGMERHVVGEETPARRIVDGQGMLRWVYETAIAQDDRMARSEHKWVALRDLV